MEKPKNLNFLGKTLFLLIIMFGGFGGYEFFQHQNYPPEISKTDFSRYKKIAKEVFETDGKEFPKYPGVQVTRSINLVSSTSGIEPTSNYNEEKGITRVSICDNLRIQFGCVEFYSETDYVSHIFPPNKFDFIFAGLVVGLLLGILLNYIFGFFEISTGW